MDKTRIIILAFVGLITISNPLFLSAQSFKEVPFYDKSKKFSISVYGTYVSSAELLDNIESEISFIRNSSIELSGGYGYGAELTYNPGILNSGISFYLSSEYLKVRDDELAQDFFTDSTEVSVRLTEEFSMIPVEAGVKWNLPVSSKNFIIYIGGGGGIYLGKRTRTLGLLVSQNISSTPGFSLNVLSGIEFYIGRNLAVDFQFKFREGYFDAKNSYSQDFINIGGQNYSLNNPFTSRIVADGVRLSAGLKYNF